MSRLGEYHLDQAIMGEVVGSGWLVRYVVLRFYFAFIKDCSHNRTYSNEVWVSLEMSYTGEMFLEPNFRVSYRWM